MTEGAVDVLLRADAGISAHTYTGVIGQLTRALEEIDHVIDVDARPYWKVTSTSWTDAGGLVQLSPTLRSRSTRTTLELTRPAVELWGGLRSLAQQPEIPAAFTASIVQRVSRVRHQIKPATGLLGVSVTPTGRLSKPAEIDEAVEANAAKAVKESSLAYGSLIGRLDLISSRGKRKIGLRIEHGDSVMCDVEGLDRDEYMQLFEQRVLASGIVKRNLRGQILSLVVDMLEARPPLEPVAARRMLGALPNLGGPMMAVDYIRQRRGDE